MIMFILTPTPQDTLNGPWKPSNASLNLSARYFLEWNANGSQKNNKNARKSSPRNYSKFDFLISFEYLKNFSQDILKFDE